MNNNFLGTGISFPFRVDDNGNVATDSNEKSIENSIRLILGTTKGERVMRPDFGCGLHDFVFAYINTSTLTLIEESVSDALMLWGPRIELVNVKASTEQMCSGKLLINVDYKVRTTNNQYNLVYPFYLTEGE